MEQPQSAPEAHITVVRQSTADMGDREIFVSLDGEELAILKHGASVTRAVKPGEHRLRAHNTLFWKTIDLTLAPGEHARYVAINRAGWGTYGIAVVLGAGPIYLTFERQDQVT